VTVKLAVTNCDVTKKRKLYAYSWLQNVLGSRPQLSFRLFTFGQVFGRYMRSQIYETLGARLFPVLTSCFNFRCKTRFFWAKNACL